MNAYFCLSELFFAHFFQKSLLHVIEGLGEIYINLLRINETSGFIPQCILLLFAIVTELHNRWRLVNALTTFDHRNKELAELVESLGQPGFRTKQIEDWIWNKNVSSLDEMTNLPKTLREALAADGRFAGIPWVVVSMGAAGSVGFHEGRAFRAKTPAIAAVNATGSGDSTIAGFAHAIAAGADDVTVLKTANTCGKLNAMDPKTGHLVMDRWDEIYNSVVVTEL